MTVDYKYYSVDECKDKLKEKINEINKESASIANTHKFIMHNINIIIALIIIFCLAYWYYMHTHKLFVSNGLRGMTTVCLVLCVFMYLFKGILNHKFYGYMYSQIQLICTTCYTELCHVDDIALQNKSTFRHTLIQICNEFTKISSDHLEKIIGNIL